MSTAARLAPTPEMAPGDYLAVRREAASKSLEEAARAYAFSPIGARTAELLLADAEAGRVVLGEPGLRRLQACFPFDARIYLALAGEHDIDIPSLCRLCGCSWDDACVGEQGRGCAWADSDETLCNRCDAPGDVR